MCEACSMHGVKNSYSILVGKHKRKLPFRRCTCKHRWENNFIMDLWEIGWEGLDWIYVT